MTSIADRVTPVLTPPELGRGPIPSEPYRSAAYFERERNHIFNQVWLCVGREDEIATPGDFIVNPRVNVMQALSMAGGTTPFASLKDIMILRRTGEGQQSALPFHYNDVAHGKDLQQNIDLQAGDIVVVP